MGKKSGIIIVALLLLIAVGYIFVQFQTMRQFEENQLFKAIPSNAPIVVFSHNILETAKEITTNDSVLSDLEWIAPIGKLKQLSQFVTDSDGICSNMTELLLQRPFAIVLQNISDSISYTLYIGLSDIKTQRTVKKWIESGNNTYKAWEIESDVFQLQFNNTNKIIFVSVKDGVLIASESKQNILNGLEVLTGSHNLGTNEGFLYVQKTVSHEAVSNVFVNLDELNSIYEIGFDSKLHPIDFQTWGNWAAFDVDFKHKSIVVNGVVNSNGIDSSKFCKIFKNLTPSPSHLLTSLPSSTIAAKVYNFGEDLEKTKQNISEYLQENNKPYLSDTLISLLKGEVALAQIDLEPGQKPIPFLLLETNSFSNALAKLKEILKVENNDALTPENHFSPNDNTQIPIFKGCTDNYISECLSPFFEQAPDNYFAVYGNYIIMADSTEYLARFLYQKILNRTLENDPLFVDFQNEFSKTSNCQVFISPKHLINLLKTPSNDDTRIAIDAAHNQINNFYAWGIQLTMSEQSILFNQNLLFSPHRKAEPKTLWQSKLDTLLVTKPLAVRWPNMPENGWMVQDASNKLYLISNNGTIVWQKKMDGPIIGEIETLDFYNNNKTQYAFSVADCIYVIDINGNNVANFPIRLPAPASCKLSVFDYEKNNDLRFFTACDDNSVMVFNKKGNRLPDWSFKGTENRVQGPVSHLRVDGKDFIVIQDQNRQYFLDRKGNERINTSKANIPGTIGPLAILDTKPKSITLAAFSKNREFVKISLPQLKIDCIKTAIEPTEGYCIRPFDAKAQTILYSDDNQIAIINNKGETIWQKSFADMILFGPEILDFGNEVKKIGITTSSEQVYILDEFGNILPNFPLGGSSRMSIEPNKEDSNKFNLIVGGRSGFLYNYELTLK